MTSDHGEPSRLSGLEAITVELSSGGTATYDLIENVVRDQIWVNNRVDNNSRVFHVKDSAGNDLVVKVFLDSWYASGAQRGDSEVMALQKLQGEEQVPRYIEHGRVLSGTPEDTTGKHFIVRSYIPHPLLFKYKEQARQSLEEAAETIARVGDLVERIHQHGLLHRDLHPGNIVVNPETGVPSIIDFDWSTQQRRFGIPVKGIGRNDLESGGVYTFLPPEERDKKIVNVRSDVYELGVLAAYSLKDFFPFNYSKPTYANLLLQTSIMVTVVAWSAPRALGYVLSKAAAEKPSDRYHSAAEFARELRAAVRFKE